MKRIIAIVLSGFMGMSFVGCVDQSGKSNTSNEDRIIATSVAACEILDMLDLDVIGVPTSDYELPENFSEATEIGTPMSPDMEIIKSLKPTDVIGSNSLVGELQPQYEAIGVNSTFLNLKNVEGLFKSILDLGIKYNREDKAKELVQDFYSFMEEYQNKNQGKESPRVLILMGLPGSYLVATENSYVGNLVKMAGGTNVFTEETKEQFVNVNTEVLSQLNPDIIIRTSHAMPDEVKEMFAEEFETNNIWKHFNAVKNEKVYDLDSKLFGMSANFKYKEALESLQPILFGEE